MNSKLSAILLILCFGNTLSAAKSYQENFAPTGLALEVIFFKGNPPAYQAVAESAAAAKWVWYARFRRIPNFQTSAERLPVRAVKFVPYLEKETVKINVTVFTGQRLFEKEEIVATYWAKKNQQIFIKELANFGVEPFEVKVIRSDPSTSVLPSIDNRTNSLRMTGVSPQLSTLPSYRIGLLNASRKDVSALTFATYLNGKPLLSGMPQGIRGKPLINSGETLVKELPNFVQDKRTTYVKDHTIVISSVVFSDGSYEGSAGEAARFLAYVLGRKQQIKEILALIQPAENNYLEVDLNEFIERAFKLETRIDEIEFAALLKKFPFLNEADRRGLRMCAETALQAVKKDFLSEMEKHRAANLESRDARAILRITREEYREWLERLP